MEDDADTGVLQKDGRRYLDKHFTENDIKDGFYLKTIDSKQIAGTRIDI
jgi:hypothetical protein